jgi:hypothetical protein
VLRTKKLISDFTELTLEDSIKRGREVQRDSRPLSGNLHEETSDGTMPPQPQNLADHELPGQDS